MKSNESIVKSVDETIDQLCKDFELSPTYFYTEDDMVSFFYYLLMGKLLDAKVPDKINAEYNHLLIHREYPTPFRCDMKGYKFEIKGDDKKDWKFKRGHYDLVLLNPKYIRRYSHEIVKAQNYGLFIKEVRNKDFNNIMLYAIEFMYSRDEINTVNAADTYIKKVKQDADKLIATRKRNYVENIRMLAFIKGSTSQICSKIENDLKDREEIKIIKGDIKSV